MSRPHGPLIPEILAHRAAVEPDRTAYVFLTEHGAEAESVTYGELHTRALGVAGWLGEHCGPGDRAVLLLPQCLDFVVAYLGCLYAGVVAVPVNPPRRHRMPDATRAVLLDCEPSAALTVTAVAESVRAAVQPLCGDLAWLAVDGSAARHGARADPRRYSPGDVAFLQYTSGSTADPKGVQVTHANLTANQEMIRRDFGHDRDSTVVGWAPFFHDQGLIGNVLQPLHVGATAVLMSPMTFVRRPMLWLSSISAYRAHTSGGPNFAFDACVAAAARGVSADLDLSSWRVAFNGAEPVRPDTLRRFADTFAPYGFAPEALHPCYGLAEATLIVTGTGPGRGPRTVEADPDELDRGRYRPAAPGHGRTLAGSGQVLPGADVRIADPDTGATLPDGEVGEIRVTGPHVAGGYRGRPDATAFGTPDGDGHRTLRTGDLGMFVDGELYVVGRTKDLVIVRGRNLHPHDLEHTVASAHPALRPGWGAAFGVPGPDGERVVVVQEIDRDHRHTADPGEILAAVRAALVREHGVAAADVVLTLPGQVRRTSSGKVMRSAARTRYLAGLVEPWAPPTAAATDRPREVAR